MGVATESSQAQFLAFQILGSFYFRLSQDTVGQGIFGAGYKNQLSDPLGKRARDRFASSNGDFTVATKHRRRYHGGRGNKNELEFEIYFLNSPTSSAIHGIDWDIVRAE